jgi:hypothetical protein
METVGVRRNSAIIIGVDRGRDIVVDRLAQALFVNSISQTVTIITHDLAFHPILPIGTQVAPLAVMTRKPLVSMLAVSPGSDRKRRVSLHQTRIVAIEMANLVGVVTLDIPIRKLTRNQRNPNGLAMRRRKIPTKETKSKLSHN